MRAISFTGSTVTGNRIVQAAGLRKFRSMELGGKSPVRDLRRRQSRPRAGCRRVHDFSNNGERCTAGSRILVQKSIYADLCRSSPSARRITVGDPLDEKTIIGPMISRRIWPGEELHRAGPEGGRDAGLRWSRPAILCAGAACHDGQGQLRWPTVFADVDNRMKIAQDEIFGPVACLIPFTDEADAIRLANDIQYGLSSYVWSENRPRAPRRGGN